MKKLGYILNHMDQSQSSYAAVYNGKLNFLPLSGDRTRRMQDVFACVWRMRKLSFFRLDKENPGTENEESISGNITNLLQKRDDS